MSFHSLSDHDNLCILPPLTIYLSVIRIMNQIIFCLKNVLFVKNYMKLPQLFIFGLGDVFMNSFLC